MRITTDKNELNHSDIQTLIQAHQSRYLHVLKLKRYYSGKHAILQKEGRKHNAPNNRLVNNYCKFISDFAVGFFIGQPATYKSADEENLEMLLDIFKYNDESAHNLELAEESSVTGTAFEILYIDEDAMIRFANVPAEEMILVCDSTLEENIIAAIRHYRVYDLNQVNYTEYVDVYDAEKIRHYSYNGVLKLVEEVPHYFEDVPVVEYPNNKERRGDFEDVLTLIDAYNMAQSLTLDDMSDFTDAFLILRGMGGTKPEDIKELRREKTLLLDEGGGAEWLTKNINDAYVENLKTRLQTDIHKFSQVPDLSDDNFAGNASGVAIKYKLIGLEQIRGKKERQFKKALQRRIELISNILRLQNKANIDFRDITMTFTANIPANVVEQVQIVNQLDGLISRDTLLGLLPFVEEPSQEIEKLKKDID